MDLSVIGNPMSLTHCGWPLERAIALLAELGVARVELCRPDVRGFTTSTMLKQLTEFIQSKGMALAGFNAADAEDFQSLSGPREVAAAITSLKRDIDIATDLGARYVSTWEGRVPQGTSRADGHAALLDASVQVFKQAVAYAEPRGIDVLVEVHPFTMGIDTDWLIRLCDGVGSECFGVTYDSCHFAVGAPNHYLDAIEELGSRIKCVHLSDSDTKSSELHFPPGKGCLDMQGLIAALKGIGFAGDWAIDVWLYPLPVLAMREGIAFLKREWEASA
jgi:sugar phosphate isomerase/epimerase